MANREPIRGVIAQDAKLTSRSDSYGPMPGEQIKTRPPAPAPMLKAQSTPIQPTATSKKQQA
jgi:hypothetical protein